MGPRPGGAVEMFLRPIRGEKIKGRLSFHGFRSVPKGLRFTRG